MVKSRTIVFPSYPRCFLAQDESREDTENLPAPEILAAEIAENLQSTLEQFNSIREELEEK